ncbi:FAD-dependent oxidoreductase [Litoribrevibacter albus]|uniref:Pyridine nucleotide-disulfide oxidoreductase n=1 Tax=Litoribrevibacter albus TaxID=1473156 RepID=A0AA37W8G8_9GAMM|nr:FAD-dependent oxidoreductase [Litoribrevibacter albus]GLQ32413.1 pyridine nucleotide-disulfide oxidoreductase [Litoribrevibacter albus]
MSKHLVLVGGGHTHVLVLKALSKKPIEDLKITLVSPHLFTPYSGMLPGLISGHYSYEDIHIDLHKLSQSTRTHFIRSKAIGLDPQQQLLFLENGESLGYELISFDTGATPDLSVPGASEHCIPVKPIDQFYRQWTQQLAQLKQDQLKQDQLKQDQLKHTDLNQPLNLSIVGSGAAGVELALAMRHKLKNDTSNNLNTINVQLVCRGNDILQGYPTRLKRYVQQKLQRQNIEVFYEFDVALVKPDSLIAKDGQHLNSAMTFWCTQARGADWLKQTQLTLSENGFIEVTPTLQTPDYPQVFAAGDVAHFRKSPLPKAGVYAVRMADTLTHNIRALLTNSNSGSDTNTNTELVPYQPQQDFLSLLACGDKSAVGCKYGFTIKGRWVWSLKDRIDRQFMNQFS